MKRGPKPFGDHTMTPAERQARFRAAHADGAPKVRYRKPGDRRSRPQRWRDAVAELVAPRRFGREGGPAGLYGLANPSSRIGAKSWTWGMLNQRFRLKGLHYEE